jgi:hypothetical protein
MEIFLKVLAGAVILGVLGFAAVAAFVIYAFSTYGDNK